MSKILPRVSFIDAGIKFGLIQPGYKFMDYILEAVKDPSGYETVCWHGQQGSGKSNNALQCAAPIVRYTLTKKLGREPTEEEVWNGVLDRIVFTPSDFVRKLEEVDPDDRLDLIIWDDIQLNYTSSTFKLDMEQYSAIDSMFAVIRTKVALVFITIPNITRLPKNVKDNVTFERFVGKNRMVQTRKIFRLPGTDGINSNLFKPVLYDPEPFNLFDIPPWAWTKYEKMRRKIADEALKMLKGVVNMEEVEGFVSLPDAVKIVRDHGLRWGIQSIQQMASRGIIQKQVINGELCVNEESLMKIVEAETYKPGT